MNDLHEICLIGSTASGKSSLALDYAHKHSGVILSLDSLAIYRGIDIASAKPTLAEREGIPHFGIDVVTPDTLFDVTKFVDLYHEASTECRHQNKPLVIVGGTGFYLKILLEGISPLPQLSASAYDQTHHILRDLPNAFRTLSSVDPSYASTIQPSDRYRIEKALLVYYGSGMAPSLYCRTHPPEPVLLYPPVIYEIYTERSLLRERIVRRTDAMLGAGLIDEVCQLEKHYTRSPNPMKAIGIKEVLHYLDGRYHYGEMREKIITNTARLAKRQVTFNKSQFNKTIQGSLDELKGLLLYQAEGTA